MAFQSHLWQLTELFAATDRGQRASAGERQRASDLVAAMEAEAPECTPTMLNGRWRLLYSSESGIYRSSPFFWAFKQCTSTLSSPVAIPGAGVAQGAPWADAVYAITDAIPFYEIGPVTQTISGVCDADDGCVVGDEVESDGASDIEEPSEGPDVALPSLAQAKVISEVRLEIARNFGLPGLSSLMTTTASLEVDPSRPVPSALPVTMAIETTAAKQSNLATLLPALGELPTFPSGSAMELLSAGSSRVRYSTTYLTERMRVSRPVLDASPTRGEDTSAFFVYVREDEM